MEINNTKKKQIRERIGATTWRATNTRQSAFDRIPDQWPKSELIHSLYLYLFHFSGYMYSIHITAHSSKNKVENWIKSMIKTQANKQINKHPNTITNNNKQHPSKLRQQKSTGNEVESFRLRESRFFWWKLFPETLQV